MRLCKDFILQRVSFPNNLNIETVEKLYGATPAFYGDEVRCSTCNMRGSGKALHGGSLLTRSIIVLHETINEPCSMIGTGYLNHASALR